MNIDKFTEKSKDVIAFANNIAMQNGNEKSYLSIIKYKYGC